MNDSHSTSDLEGAFAAAKSVKSNELSKLMNELELFTICIVEDMDCMPVVLVGYDEPERYRHWLPFNGETKADLELIIKWRRDSVALYGEKARSSVEMDNLRQVMLSIGRITKYIGEDHMDAILGECVAKIAYEWYQADKKDTAETIDKFSENKDVCVPYINLVHLYIERLAAIMGQISESRKAFEEAKKHEAK